MPALKNSFQAAHRHPHCRSGLARRDVELGASFVGIGSDVGLCVNAKGKLVADFRGGAAGRQEPAGAGQVY